MNDYLGENDKTLLPEATVKTLEDQIREMEDPNHRIRDLVQRRIVDFCKQAISASRTAPLQVKYQKYFLVPKLIRQMII